MAAFSSLLFPPFVPYSGIGLFALKPLFIAGMTRPVVDGDGGINIAVVNDYADGVLCVIDPYPDMQVGDKHDIYWGALRIWTKDVLPEELNKRLFFYLPIAPIVPGWVETVHYQLTRKGSTAPDDPSVPLRLLVKLDEPGGDDKEPHKPGHSELKKVEIPEDVRLNGVTAEWAEKGVPLTVPVYPGIRVRDVIYVYWGSVRLAPHVVTQAQVDGSDPIIIVADQEAILAGGDSAALLVEYEVRDEVWNWCQKRSMSIRVLVDAGAWRLEQPIIKESINGVIDLIKLGKDDVTVQIPVLTDDFDIGDTVVMTWIGTPVHGEQLIHRSKPTPIDNIPSVLELKVPNADVRAIAMGKADVAYVLTKANGGPPLSSRRTFANVVGEVSLLPAPTIRQAIADTLDPDESMATVDIGPTALIKGGDLIDLVWLGTTSSGGVHLHEISHLVSDGEAGKIITIPVMAEHIKVLANGKLELFYRVSNDQSTLYGVKESEHAFFNVERIRAELPAPKVVEAPDDFLDPAWVPDFATLRIGYPGTAAGDRLTYYWRGSTAAGSTSDWIPITTIIAGKPVDFRIDEQFITPNLNQQVEVRYTLLRAATGKYSYSAELELNVGKEVKPNIDKVTDSQLRDIANGGTTVDTVVILSGKATPNLKVVITDNGALPQTVDVGPDGTWTSTRSGLSRVAHSFVAKASYGSGLESPAWVVNVVVEVQPTIDKVTDSQLRDIANGGTTVDTTVILTGKGRGNLSVDIWDNGVFLRNVPVPASGTWIATFTGLTRTGHSFVAKSEALESAPWILTVVALVTPIITKVLDPQGSAIGNGGTTTATSVRVSGTASANTTVEVRDNGGAPRDVPVDGNGSWGEISLSVAVGFHSIKAKGLYGSNPESTARTFTVISPTPTLIIDNSQLVLSALHFRSVNVTPSNPPTGAFATRSASGGVLPYRYTSSNSAIAEVNETTGKVISHGNGSATITVRDSANQTASYPVTASNVQHLFGTGSFNTYTECSKAAASQGGRIPSLAEWRSYIQNYSGIRTIERWCWASDSGGVGKRWAIYPADGSTKILTDLGFGGDTADGFGIRPA